MSYAHYLSFFSYKQQRPFLDFITDAKAIMENHPEGVNLCGEKTDSPPEANERVLIVGDRDSQRPFGTLKIEQDTMPPEHRFPIAMIITDRRPYDIVIAAILLAFVHHFPSAEVTSDGTTEDWAQAIALYEFTTERKAPTLPLRSPLPTKKNH